MNMRVLFAGMFLTVLALSLAAQDATNQPPHVVITSPGNIDYAPAPALYAAPAEITIEAQVFDADGFFGTVEFFENTNRIGVVTNHQLGSTFTMIWSNVPAGHYEISAKATDDEGAIDLSPVVHVFVVDTNTVARPEVNIYDVDNTGMEVARMPPWVGAADWWDVIVFTVTRTGPTTAPLTAYYRVGGTASNGTDYIAGWVGGGLSGRVTIPAGASGTNMVVFVTDDYFVEGTETIELTLEPPPCAAMVPPPPGCCVVGAENRAVANIADNDVALPPEVWVVASDPEASESSPNTGRFTVHRNQNTNQALGVFYTIRGTAQNGVDFTTLSNLVVIPADATSAEIIISPTDDGLAEGSETVQIELRAPIWPDDYFFPRYARWPWYYLIGTPSNAVVTIADNDLAETNEAPFVRLDEPRDGAVFGSPTNIELRAYAQDRDDGYFLRVEFFEGVNSLGFGTFVPTRCADYCPYYSLTWSNAPPGEYVLTARAVDSDGNVGISGPVRINVHVGIPPGTKLWDLEAGIVYGAPAVGTDGTVYVPAGNAVVRLFALTSGGEVKWSTALAGGGSSPAIGADGTIYIARADGTNTFRAHNREGIVVWSVPLRVTSTFLGFASPAIASDGTIYVAGEGIDKGLHALRPDGTVKWRFTPAGTAVFTPVVGADGTVYFGVANDGFYAVDSSGGQHWRVAMTGSHIWAAVGGDGTIYVVGSSSPTKLFAFASDGRKKWETQIGPSTSQHASAPVIGPDGSLFVVSDQLYAFESDGSPKWAVAPPADLGHSPLAPAVDAHGNVYAGLGGHIVVVNGQGSQLWSYPDRTTTAPTLTSDGILYIGSGDTFYAFQANAPVARSPWPMFQRDPQHTGAAPLSPTAPVVNIVARDALASEGNFWRHDSDVDWVNDPWTAELWNTWRVNVGGTNTATFVVRRHGPTNANLTVEYDVAGTAANGVDYATLPGSVTIAAGKRTARIAVVPIDDSVAEGIETIVLQLRAAPDYTPGVLARAAGIILDNDRPRPPCVMLPDGHFHVCRAATNGFSFRLEASSDLLRWIPVCTNIVTEGAIHFVDPDTRQFNARFYRVAAQPPLSLDD